MSTPPYLGIRFSVLPMLMTETEAAEVVCHSRATLARERRLGRLPYVRGRPPLIWRDDLLAWLARRRVDVARHVLRNASGYDPVRVANRSSLSKRARQP